MKKYTHSLLRYVLIGLGLSLVACSSDDADNYEEMPVEVIYNRAMDLLEAGSYQDAAKEFDEVDRQHPYSPWATKAQIMAAYANYRGQKYERCLAGLEAFVQLHPAHADVPYALYMQGLCYYEQLSPSGRDQQDTVFAIEAFNDLTRRFPKSDYAKDARLKLNLLNDAMAGKQMAVGRFYMERKAYGAAINRFKEVVTRYDTTKHVEEALLRMVECYLAMGLQDQAQQSAAVLGHNYPSSPWYAEAYQLTTGKSLPTTVESVRDQEESWYDRLRNWNKGARKSTTVVDEEAAKESVKELSGAALSDPEMRPSTTGESNASQE